MLFISQIDITSLKKQMERIEACFSEISEKIQPKTLPIFTHQGQLLLTQVSDGNLVLQASNINRDKTLEKFEERISKLEKNVNGSYTANTDALTLQISKNDEESFTTESGETLQISYIENVSVEVEEKLNKLKTNLITLENTLRVSQESFNELQNVMQISNSNVKKMEQTIKTSRKHNTELQEELQKANTSISHLQTELQKSQSDLKSMTDKFNASQIRLEELENLVQGANLDMNSLQENCIAVQNNLHRSLEIISTIQNMGNGRSG